MHLLEQETQIPGVPHAYEITWTTCACARPDDHHAQPAGPDAPSWQPVAFRMPEDLLAITA